MTASTEIRAAMVEAALDAWYGKGAWTGINRSTRIDEMTRAITAAILAAEARGFKLVPMVLTQKMYDAAGAIIEREYGESDWETSKDMAEGLSPTPIWNAMIAAHEGDGT